MDPKLLDWQKKELVPLGRFSQPEEQAYLTLLLLDPVMGAYCTGQEYFIEYVRSFPYSLVRVMYEMCLEEAMLTIAAVVPRLGKCNDKRPTYCSKYRPCILGDTMTVSHR